MGTLISPPQGEANAVLLDTVGDNVVYTPVGRLLVYWVGMSTPQNNPGEVIVTVRIGSNVKYIWAMGNPGAFTHRDLIQGAKGEALIVNLSQAFPVYFNYTSEEVY